MRRREEPMQNRLAVLLVAVAAFSTLVALAQMAPNSTLIFAAIGLCLLLVFFWFAGRGS
jgi:Flp pilus assembly protein protease CpaA